MGGAPGLCALALTSYSIHIKQEHSQAVPCKTPIAYNQGLNCQKISGGLTSACSLSLSLHTGDSASLTTAGD
jgi:hypothetical protein